MHIPANIRLWKSFSGESAYGLPSYNPTQKSFLKWRKNVFSLVLK